LGEHEYLEWAERKSRAGWRRKRGHFLDRKNSPKNPVSASAALRNRNSAPKGCRKIRKGGRGEPMSLCSGQLTAVVGKSEQGGQEQRIGISLEKGGGRGKREKKESERGGGDPTSWQATREICDSDHPTRKRTRRHVRNLCRGSSIRKKKATEPEEKKEKRRKVSSSIREITGKD